MLFLNFAVRFFLALGTFPAGPYSGCPIPELGPVARSTVDDQLVSVDVGTVLISLGGSAIVATGTVGAVILTGRHAGKAERAQQRLDAYAGLLVAAGEVLGTYRRVFEGVSPDFGPLDADKANARLADLSAALHRASAVVALTGSAVGREQGKILYRIARQLASSRLVPTGDSGYPFDMITKGGDEALEAAIEVYKDALVPETTALP
jgi:hypothetical protein